MPASLREALRAWFSPYRSWAPHQLSVLAIGGEPESSCRSLLPGTYPTPLLAGVKSLYRLAGSGQHRLKILEDDPRRYF
jgi:hypothetical protein